MTVVPATVFTNPDVRLRVWFNDSSHGWQQLTPDQRIAAVGYAMIATAAETAATVSDGAITSAKIAAGAVGRSQLAARALLDDDSQLALAAAEVAWSVDEGPLAGINATGLATAGSVYQDTPALARGVWGAQSSTLALMVLNTLPDNYGSYAADGIDDDWQADYYGLDNPSAAPGYNPFGTGDNLFKFTAGLDPTDAESRLYLRIARTSSTTALEVEPIVAGRTYSIIQASTLGAVQWDTLTPDEIRNSGAVRTFVSETNAPSLFYRVRIQKP